MNAIYYESCLEASLSASAACDRCAEVCLRQANVGALEDCIKLAFACSAICSATAKMIAGNNVALAEIAELCVQLCESCATACDPHVHIEACRDCRLACLHCANTCRELAEQFSKA